MGTPRWPSRIVKLAAPARPESFGARGDAGEGRVGPQDPSHGKDALAELPRKGRTMGAAGATGAGSRFLRRAGRAPAPSQTLPSGFSRSPGLRRLHSAAGPRPGLVSASQPPPLRHLLAASPRAGPPLPTATPRRFLQQLLFSLRPFSRYFF